MPEASVSGCGCFPRSPDPAVGRMQCANVWASLGTLVTRPGVRLSMDTFVLSGLSLRYKSRVGFAGSWI